MFRIDLPWLEQYFDSQFMLLLPYTCLARPKLNSPAMLVPMTIFLFALACGSSKDPPKPTTPTYPQKGNMSMHGGTPTTRKQPPIIPDDPYTSNDESNDQPLGFYGTMTLDVTNLNSGNSYPLDGDIEGLQLQRLYFPKGGWVDFYDCELDYSYCGTCDDENGTMWSIEGESYSLPSSTYDDGPNDEEDNDDD